MIGSTLNKRIDMKNDEELRDFFAAFAMSRMVRQDNEYEEVAEWSYQMADAMLAERTQKRERDD
jgi:hypothetical protein